MFNKGDQVVYLGVNGDRGMHCYYPEIGTVGVVVCIDDDMPDYCIQIQWPRGSTSGDDAWLCNINKLELFEEHINEETFAELDAFLNEIGGGIPDERSV